LGLQPVELSSDTLLSFALLAALASGEFRLPALPVLGYSGHTSFLAWNDGWVMLSTISPRQLDFV
jgi:hypothetical protein